MLSWSMNPEIDQNKEKVGFETREDQFKSGDWLESFNIYENKP